MREFWTAKRSACCSHGAQQRAEVRTGKRTIRYASLRNSSAVSRLNDLVGGASWLFNMALNAVVKFDISASVPAPGVRASAFKVSQNVDDGTVQITLWLGWV